MLVILTDNCLSNGTTAPNPHGYPWSESNKRFGVNHPTLVLKVRIPKKNMFPDRWELIEDRVGCADNAK
jgi:hypothetical protein